MVSVTTSKSMKTKSGPSAQPGRKGKKAWRKHVDIGEVEASLEELRTEERLGGRALHQLTDERLFFTDTLGTLDTTTGKPVQRYRLKMEEILANTSALPSLLSSAKPSSTRRLDAPAPSGKVKLVSKSLHRQVESLARRKREQGALPGTAMRQKQMTRLAREATLSAAKGGYDLWGGGDVAPHTKVTAVVAGLPFIADVIEVQRKQVAPPQNPVPLAAKVLPAVTIAHAGTSYNPTFEEHQAALQLAVDAEVERAERLKRYKDAVTPKLPHVVMADEEEWMQSDEDENNAPAEGEEEEDMTARQRMERKTKTERNRKRKAGLQAEEEKKMAQAKRIHKEINRLEEIQREVISSQNKKSQSKGVDEVERLLKKPSSSKLGPYKHRPGASMEIQLTEELVDSLRQLKPEGNLFKDRFASLQQRQLIETRLPVRPVKRKFALKRVETHDYKRFS